MAVGTTIYSGRSALGWANNDRILCWSLNPPETVYYSLSHGVKNPPLPLADGFYDVYQTGIPGIGVRLGNGVSGATVDNPLKHTLTISLNGAKTGLGVNFVSFINLVKTGPLVPGTYTLNSFNLPIATRYFDNPTYEPPILGFPMFTANVQYQGVINISAQTCMTPDVNVPMGSYNANETFTGINSATPWVKVNLSLTNCPTFHGYYNQYRVQQLYDGDNGGQLPSGIKDSLNNQISVRFTPATPVIDAANGIMAINTSEQSAASGIGIQLGWGEGTPGPINLTTEKLLNLPKDGSPTINVPVSARYIQTDDKVTPGRANGKVTFTINYY